MPFVPIYNPEIQTGEAVSSVVMGKVQGNFDDHETRLQQLEGGATTTYPPLIFRVGGAYDGGGARDNVVKTTTNFPITITGVRLIIDQAGNTGITQIDVKKKSGGGSWTSIMTTKPSVNASAGSDAISGNGVLNNSQTTLSAGDLIRLDLESVQNLGIGFIVRIDYVRA